MGPVSTKSQLLQHLALLLVTDGRPGDHEEHARFLTPLALPLCNLLPQAAVPALRRAPPRLVHEPALAGSTEHLLAKLTSAPGHTHCFAGQRACASPARARPHGSPERSPSTAATKTDHLAAAEEETPDTAVKLEPDESEDNLETK